MKRVQFVLTRLISIVIACALCIIGAPYKPVSAETAEVLLDNGRKYEFEEKSDYVFSDTEKYSSINVKKNDDGHIYLTGDLTNLVEINGIPAFGVNGGMVSFTYQFGDPVKETDEEKWHVISDGGKEVNGFKLSSSIGKGAILVQTSQDGNTWVNDRHLTNVLNDEFKVVDFYKTKNIQLVSGSFYRIITVYEMAKKTGESKVLFITRDINEIKKYAEVFEFYLHDTKSSSFISDSTVSMSLGTKVRTEKNDGYYGEKPIDIKDPHYGWELGNFFVSGYTADTVDKDGNPVFLKNLGDQVTLWFNLEQDIDRLNGDDNLTINADTSGYDRDFEVKKTNFGKGALIIRKIDYRNKIGTPEIYTNYLEANASTDADTIVGLFEEGDYEVALDYEIKNTPRQVGKIDVIPEYSDYTIRFRFAIRNSNCMLYPFDIETGEELIDNAITPNGFKLDLAKSRYLNVNVQKFAVSKGSNGYVLDERFNRAAKDSDSFDEEGVYVFTVYNEYTKVKTPKTMYVGDSPIIKALAKTGKSIDEINDVLNNGGKIEKDGTLTPKKSD